MKKLARRTAFVIAAAVVSVGVVSVPTSAHADTGWGWRVVAHHQR
ncbi:hypothetical protein ACFQ3F_21370 [Nocardioides ginsengisoli]|jgi:hypothetical protein|uniref:Uncharacterized protein n=1 Tax=Nocardioides ginsengisoli TaxID=363868 RepID=A0ABW3W754_9ACTN